MANFYKLTIKEVKRETPDSISVVFNIPPDLAPFYTFIAGQYVNLKLTLDGKEVRRAYSICSAPNSGELRISIKAIQDGFFSVFANRELAVGHLVDVGTPEGRFTFEPDAHRQKTYVAFVAGSGITPVMSILQTLLEEEPKSSFVLVYGNKTPESTIFYDKLNALHDKYVGRFFLYYVFSQAKLEGNLFGRIDKPTVNFILKNKHKEFDFENFYLCGPNEMIAIVKDILKENKTPENKIKFELFTTTEKEAEIEQNSEGQCKVTVRLDDVDTTFYMPSGTVVLDAVLKQGLDAPYSCQGGICSSCIAKVTDGSAQMKKNSILTDKEIADGFVLTCQAVPTTNEIFVDYDEV
ncbi:MAG TPA: 2Fe-2S iron-sulfur cluster-binding protein [Flavobacterium sp.]|nr:2Fe-2S iron-sulfur cluster-binding protein [Flavobacterium sp.]